MSNILDEIRQEVLTIKELLQKQDHAKNILPRKITFKQYCEEEQISRPTGYKRAELGLIRLQKVGGKNYVHTDSITLVKKYERVPA